MRLGAKEGTDAEKDRGERGQQALRVEIHRGDQPAPKCGLIIRKGRGPACDSRAAEAGAEAVGPANQLPIAVVAGSGDPNRVPATDYGPEAEA